MNQDTMTQATPDVGVLPLASRFALVSAVSFVACNLVLSLVFEDLYCNMVSKRWAAEVGSMCGAFLSMALCGIKGQSCAVVVRLDRLC